MGHRKQARLLREVKAKSIARPMGYVHMGDGSKVELLGSEQSSLTCNSKRFITVSLSSMQFPGARVIVLEFYASYGTKILCSSAPPPFPHGFTSHK